MLQNKKNIFRLWKIQFVVKFFMFKLSIINEHCGISVFHHIIETRENAAFGSLTLVLKWTNVLHIGLYNSHTTLFVILYQRLVVPLRQLPLVQCTTTLTSCLRHSIKNNVVPVTQEYTRIQTRKFKRFTKPQIFHLRGIGKFH